MRKIMIALAMAACAAGVAHGQQVDGPAAQAPQQRWHFYGGGFRPAASDPPSSQDGWALGLGVEKPLGNATRFGAGALLYGTRYVTPTNITCGLFCTVNPTMSLTVVGANGSLSYTPRLGIVEFEVGAGIGLYWSRMSASASTFGLSGQNSETSLGLGTDMRLGVAVHLSEKQTLGIHFRRLNLDASFGPLSNNRSMPVGGAMALVSYTVRR